MPSIHDTLDIAVPRFPEPGCDANGTRAEAFARFIDGHPDVEDVRALLEAARPAGMGELLADLARPAGFVTADDTWLGQRFGHVPFFLTDKTLSGCGRMTRDERRSVYETLIAALHPEAVAGIPPATLTVVLHHIDGRAAPRVTLLTGLQSEPVRFNAAVRSMKPSEQSGLVETATVTRRNGEGETMDTPRACGLLQAFAMSGDFAARCKLLAATRELRFDGETISNLRDRLDEQQQIDPLADHTGAFLHIRNEIDEMTPHCPPRLPHPDRPPMP